MNHTRPHALWAIVLLCLLVVAAWSVSASTRMPRADTRPDQALQTPVSPPADDTSLVDLFLTTIPRLTTDIKQALNDPASLTNTLVLSPMPDADDHATAMLPTFVDHLMSDSEWDRYTINVTLDPQQRTITGSERVHITNRTAVPYESLSWHLYPNHPDFGGSLVVQDDVLVDGAPAATRLEQDSMLLHIALPQPLQPGDTTVVDLNFEARTPRNSSGISYGAFNQESGVWALASFYPVLTYRFPDGWDHRPVTSRADFAFTDIALYDVTIDIPQEWTLVTTGSATDAAGEPPHHSAPPASGMHRTHVVSGPQRDFFIAALNGLDQASTVVDGTTIITYYQPRNAEAGQQTLTVAATSLQAFNEMYGRYPFNELEIVQAALTGFLGVEYPGVVLIEQSLYRPGATVLDTTVAHEVAHQWWYNLVGNDTQGQGWIDEGLASYSQIIYYEWQGNLEGAERELNSFRTRYISARAASRDGVVNSHADSLHNNYVILTYAKSALFLQALRIHMGDEAFFQFVQRYYDTYRYREATGDEMLSVAEATCRCGVHPLYQSWINSTEAVEVP